jgi:uncharacterized protein (TIGR02996 family)
MATTKDRSAVAIRKSRMFSDEALLLSVLDRPDDDAPRLVYADWLEEHGDCDRAELIRLQCDGADAPRVRELLDRHAAEWAGPAVRRAYSYTFRRGFVEEVTVEAGMFLESGERLFAAAPVRLLRVIGARAVLNRLVESPLLDRLRALHLTGCQIGDEGAELLAGCPFLAGVRTLRLGQNALGDRAVEALTGSDQFGELTGLVLHGNLVGDLGARLLASNTRVPHLQALDLSDNLIGDAGAAALARASGLGRLTRLNLANQFKGWSSGLRGRPYPIQPPQQRALVARFGAETCVF